MKRILIVFFILSMAVSVAGCGAQQQGETEPSALPESGSSTEQSQEPKEEEPEAEEKDPALEPLETVLIEAIEKWGMFPTSDEKLNAMGISVRMENIHIAQKDMREIADKAGALTYESYWTTLPESVYEDTKTTPWGTEEAGFPFTFELVLQHQNGAVRTWEVEGYGYYSGPLTGNIRPVWGSLSIVDDSTIALTTLRQTEFFNAVNFETDDKRALNLTGFEGKNYALNHVFYHESLGYIAPMCIDGKSYITIFNQDGTMKESRFIEQGEYRGFDTDPINYLTYFRNYAAVDLDVPVLIFEDSGYSGNNISVFRTDDFVERSYNSIIDLDAGGKIDWYPLGQDAGIYLFSTFDTEGMPYNGAPTGVIAVYVTGGKQSGYAQFGTDIPMRWDFGLFNSSDYETERERIGQFDEQSGVFTMYSPAGGQSLRINLKNHTGTLVYDIREEALEHLAERSPNLRYELWQANSMGMGDAYWGNLALKDTQTGTITYLGEYGSGTITNPADFIDDTLVIYKPLVLDIAFYRTSDGALDREIQLAYDQEVEGRVTFNATYDPQTERYFVAYIDGNTHEGYPRDFTTETYNVAVFNSRGEQTGTIATDIPGSTGPIYSLYCPPMKASEDTLWLDGKAVDISIKLEL